MQLLISYDDGTTESVPVRPQADTVSAWGSFQPGIQLLREPTKCRWGSDFFSAAINEGKQRAGHERPSNDDDDDEKPTPGFSWRLVGTEVEYCQEAITRWIDRLGGVFDPEAHGRQYVFGGLLRILGDDEVATYEDDQKCWLFYMLNPRAEALKHLTKLGLRPSWPGGSELVP